jgi:UDP-N-acetylmuramoyl-L-alanyl-D-glutamate--2,6-diaminopimelate ligase
MRLEQLLSNSDVKVWQHPASSRDLMSLDIDNVTLDSRKCKAKTLFVAAKGATSSSKDGNAFIDEALKRRASAVITDTPVESKAPILICDNARRLVAQCAEALAGFPSHKLQIFGVTGTNGKTSVTFFLASILKSAGFKSAVVGTLGIGDIDALNYTGFTTPEAETISSALLDLQKQRISHVAMEVSSHALALHRCDGILFAAAAFTNLSEDHLDFHVDMASYRKAKERLFFELLAPSAPCVIPLGDPLAEQLYARGRTVLTFGRSLQADIAIEGVQTSRGGTQVSLRLRDQVRTIDLPVFGDFNLDNVMAAAGLALAKGVSSDAIFRALHSIRLPPGRLEPIYAQERGDKPLVFVDFAHTPDALEKVLVTTRAFTKGKLRLVFGCGGDRDRLKRPMMGNAAARLADEVWVTNDNPRHEDERQIFDDILSGVEPFMHEKFKIIPDRVKAITEAIGYAQLDDTILIAGKGHETTQQIGDEYIPFSDESIAKLALEVW